MADEIQGTMLDEADEALTEDMLGEKPNLEIVSSAPLLLKQIERENKDKKTFKWKDAAPDTSQPMIPEFEEFVQELDAEERRKKEEAERLTPEQAEILMDRMDETLDEWTALSKYMKSLSHEQRVETAIAFLDRHDHNDRLFFLNGYSHLENHAGLVMGEVRDKIIAMRPYGMNTYCFRCDRCHDKGECEK